MSRTSCYDWHVAHNGRMVDFAGWQMPVQYTSIIEEHQAVRNMAGLFDIAHMGRIAFSGTDVCSFLDSLLTNDINKLKPGDVRYSLVTNEAGGILDDVLVYRYDDDYQLVVNASNRTKILDWLTQHQSQFEVGIDDLTTATFMLAIQGPESLDILQPLVDCDLATMKYYSCTSTEITGLEARVSRTGYTGEDGFEVTVAADSGRELWASLLESGQGAGLLPCGLGARDTLRLEAAMPLYGHELHEEIDPLTAGLSFAVKLNAGNFIGKDALVKVKEQGPQKKRVGIELEGRRVARGSVELFSNQDKTIGIVTSGTFSPTLEKPIGMAYVQPDYAAVGTKLEADLRGKRIATEVVPLPFYKRG